MQPHQPGHFAEANAAGRTAREASRVQADLYQQMAAYPGLFAVPEMKTVPDLLAMAIAFGAPGYTAAELRMAARTSLWIFGIDWLIDRQATSAVQVNDLVARCLSVVDGQAVHGEDDDLTRFLANLQADLATTSAFGVFRPLWRTEFRRVLDAMATEWGWKHHLGVGAAARRQREPVPAGGGIPSPPVPTTMQEYLAIADNFGSAWVNVAHWISIGDPMILEHLEDLHRASLTVQSALRLANDLATSAREQQWGDLNALALGFSETQIRTWIGDLATRTRQELDPLRLGCPQGVRYLLGQLDYSLQFYGIGHDYWDTADLV